MKEKSLPAGLIEEEKIAHIGLAGDVWRRFRRNKLALVGMGIILFMILVAIFAPWIALTTPEKINYELVGEFHPPSLKHPFGTDELGRDYFSRAVWGARISLGIGFTAMLIAVSIGTIYGLIAGYYGGMVDNIMMRFVDMMLAFPTFFLILTVEAVLDKPSIFIVMAVIGLFSWMGVARLVRGEVLKLKEMDFIQSARALGAGDMRIILKHLLPNSMGPVIVAATLKIGTAILIEAGLSFLGLGVQPPTPSWGNMLKYAQENMFKAPWLAIFPGILIVITVLGFNFLGDGLRDSLDPKLRE